MAIGRCIVGVPGDEDGARALLTVEPQQHVGEAENGARGPIAFSADVFRQRVIGAMREGIAVDQQQRAAAFFPLPMTSP